MQCLSRGSQSRRSLADNLHKTRLVLAKMFRNACSPRVSGEITPAHHGRSCIHLAALSCAAHAHGSGNGHIAFQAVGDLSTYHDLGRRHDGKDAGPFSSSPPQLTIIWTQRE